MPAGGDGAGAGSTGEWTPRTLRGRGGLPRLLHHPAEKARPRRLRRTALILVGHVLAGETFDDSALYDAAHHHLPRPRKKRAACKAG